MEPPFLPVFELSGHKIFPDLYCLIATHKSLILAGVLLTPRKKGQVTERNNLADKLGRLPLSSIRSWTFGPIMFFTTLNFSSNPRIKEMILLGSDLHF